MFKLIKLDFNSSERPLFIAAFIFIIWCKPSIERWFLLEVISTMCWNKIKSAAFWVNKGYFVKWGMITFIKSLKFLTVYLMLSCLESIFILPIPPKNCCNINNKDKSRWCNVIWKFELTIQPILVLLFLVFLEILVIKELSPSERPVTNQAFNLGWVFKVENVLLLFNWLEGILSW
uniref:LAGLIDADG endonuclease n=1 Tax=Clavaria fumosa TaxID=264083 RepID=A0A7T3PCQ0_9AGAR|nr:LAGLIDADG endonuclease [Clavaria fumosa]QPZ51075.1 LAGLIDADG endonuclease [Clavaria fumosa]